MPDAKLANDPPHDSHSTAERFHGGQPLRGLEGVPRSTLHEGRFGRMFRNLPPFEPDDNDLVALANLMVEPEDLGDAEKKADNPSIPAGFTYLGQFLDHDITYDPNSTLQRDNDPDALRNFRTPRFDLDSLYADGPSNNPFIYDDDGIHLLVGKNKEGEDDLPRNCAEIRRALVGDPRNDENAIVSQIHLAFIKFHNRIVDTLTKDGVPKERLFDEARRIVRWHYQRMILDDFLPHILGDGVVSSILKLENYKVRLDRGTQDIKGAVKVDLKFFEWKNQPFMPVEFSVAAYRFGHSMVRGDYALNKETSGDDNEVPIFAAKKTDKDLSGFKERRAGIEIEWKHFFAFPGKRKPQPSRKIDTKLAFALSTLPQNVTGDLAPNPIGQMLKALAVRNLLRGKALGLPSGQTVARAMGIPDSIILKDKDLKLPRSVPDPIKPRQNRNLKAAFGEHTPLWYYILKEAEVRCGGKKLGPVGGRIVAEVFVGLLAGDPSSFLNVEPTWRPKKGRFGATRTGKYLMTDLLSFAGVTISKTRPRRRARPKKKS